MIRLYTQEAGDRPQKQKHELDGLNLNSVTFWFFYAVAIAQTVQNMTISCGYTVKPQEMFIFCTVKPLEMVIFCTVKPQEMFIFCTVKPQEMFIFCTVCAIVKTYIEEPK